MELKDISGSITQDSKDVCSKCHCPFAWPGGNEWYFLSCFLTPTKSGDKLCGSCALDGNNRVVKEWGEEETTADSVMEWTDKKLFQTIYESLESWNGPGSWCLDEIKRRFYIQDKV